jgi:hypothetical protein
VHILPYSHDYIFVWWKRTRIYLFSVLVYETIFISVKYILVLFAASCFGVFSLVDGTTDTFYVKFTTPKQTSLIVGSSRAAQGVQPRLLDSVLKNTTIYNYAFSRIHTPYGSSYLESIKKKLSTDSRDGIFLVCVNPWTISVKKKEQLDETPFFEEDLSFSGKLNKVNSKPNLSDLLNFYNDRNIEIILKKFSLWQDQTFFIHNDGWYEARSDNNENKFNNLTNSTIHGYKNIRDDYIGLSTQRLF